MSNIHSLNASLLENEWVAAEMAARPELTPLDVLVMAAKRFCDDARAMACK